MTQIDSCGHPTGHSSMLIDGNWLCYSCTQKELSGLRKFVSEFEAWLEPDAEPHVRYQWQAMKRQFLEARESEDDERQKIK
ncbi:hypothetical protein LCGC14_1574080 [marine sediment metagenome]|uniref:Zinc finger CHC2-type domain-containing protein n=1 Tax=marine sediment metagenome TaxID=412755 RepID=A0A0F9L009_9ZZZZ